MDKEDMEMIELVIFSALFALFALINLYRLIKDPTVAGDSADILISCAMILYALYTGRGIFLDVAIISALLGIINTMLVGRYLDKGRWHDGPQDSN